MTRRMLPFTGRSRDSVSTYLKSLPMRKHSLTHKKALEKLGQLQVFTTFHADEKGRDQRPKLPPLVSLKLARIMEPLEKLNEQLEAELKKLGKLYIAVNAEGTQIPVLTPMGDKQTDCEHDPLALAPVKTAGNEGKWKCNECGLFFAPHPSALMLVNGEIYHEEREKLMDGTVTLETLTLSMAEIAQFPEVSAGTMSALLAFVDLDVKSEPPASSSKDAS